MSRNVDAKREYDREYIKRNYDRKLELNRQWRRRTGYKYDPKKAIEATRKWQAANPEKVKLNRKRRQLRMYGLTIEQYNDMVLSQGEICASCGDDIEFSKCHVDHNHATGVVRGILCSGCNIALGHVKEDIGRLHKLIEYLVKHQ